MCKMEAQLELHNYAMRWRFAACDSDLHIYADMSIVDITHAPCGPNDVCYEYCVFKCKLKLN